MAADVWTEFADVPSDEAQRAYDRNKAYAKPADSYLTKLSPKDEAQFQAWVKKNNIPFDPSSTADYDMRGFFKGLMSGDSHASTGINQNDKKLHFSDHWKTPYHKSFSAESQYATDQAPRWNEQDQLVTPDGKIVFDERAQNAPQAKAANDPWSEFADASDAQRAIADGAPLIPGDAGYDPRPSPEPSAFRGVVDYGRKLNDAFGALNRAPDTGGLGSLEAAASVLTGTVAAPILGTADALITGKDPEQAFQRYTYQPRSQSGKAQLGVLGAALSPITESGADMALLPLAAESGVPAKIVRDGTASAIRRVLPRPRDPVAAADVSGPAVQGTAKAAGRQGGLEGVSQADTEVAPDFTLETKPAAAKAKQYVTQLGVDWGRLPQAIQKTLADVAVDSKALENLDPVALKRELELQSLPVPVPATRGILTRDPVQMRNEGNVAATQAGAPIRQVHLDANEALLKNLDVLKGRTRGQANTPEQVGMSVQDQALRAKYKLAKERVGEKYKAAEQAGEMQGRVSPAPIIKAISESPDKTHFGWVSSWLKQTMGKNPPSAAKSSLTSVLTEKTHPARTLSLKELEDLRQAAVARAMDGGTEGFYAGKIISAIDKATEGAGGAKYKGARAARRAMAMEFEEQGAVARLVEGKSRTDRATALEDTWRKTVIGGSLADIRNVKRSLLTGGDAKTRSAGKQAWRDIRAQTIQFIKDEATKSVALDERGNPNITPASMKRAIDKIGPEKMNEVFGPGTSQRVNQVLEATRTVKTEPPAIHKGSSTLGNVLSLLERGLDRVPIVGSIGSGTLKAGVKLKELGEQGKVVRQSAQTPLNTARQMQAKRRNALADQ